jgi:hypothetical protein
MKEISIFPVREKSLPIEEELRLRASHEGIMKWVRVIEMDKILDKLPFLFCCRRQQN